MMLAVLMMVVLIVMEFVAETFCALQVTRIYGCFFCVPVPVVLVAATKVVTMFVMIVVVKVVLRAVLNKLLAVLQKCRWCWWCWLCWWWLRKVFFNCKFYEGAPRNTNTIHGGDSGGGGGGGGGGMVVMESLFRLQIPTRVRPAIETAW
jgi:uncharacterized membrane protein YgcG